MNSKEITAEDLFIKHFVVEAAIKNGETEERYKNVQRK